MTRQQCLRAPRNRKRRSPFVAQFRVAQRAELRGAGEFRLLQEVHRRDALRLPALSFSNRRAESAARKARTTSRLLPAGWQFRNDARIRTQPWRRAFSEKDWRAVLQDLYFRERGGCVR